MEDVLVGIVLDVSGSMRQSLGGSSNRLSAVWESLRQTLREGIAGRAPEIRLFACLCGVQAGRGVADLMSLVNMPDYDPLEVAKQTGLEKWYLAARKGFSKDQLRWLAAALVRRPDKAAELRARLPQRAQLQGNRGGCVGFLFNAGKDINQATKFAVRLAEEELESRNEPPRLLAELAQMFENNDPFAGRDLDQFLFGATPLVTTLERMRDRFEDYKEFGRKKRLIVISDGAATDGNPLPVAKQMRERGIEIVACLIASDDVVAPRVFPRWRFGKDGIATMGKIASSVREAPELAETFRRLGWTYRWWSRLLIQANHTKLLDELFRGVLIER
jgi:hypothetical protein